MHRISSSRTQCFTPSKIQNFFFWKIYETIFKLVLAISKHTAFDPKQSFFQKMTSEFMKPYSVWSKIYFRKFWVFQGACFINFLKTLILDYMLEVQDVHPPSPEKTTLKKPSLIRVKRGKNLINEGITN